MLGTKAENTPDLPSEVRRAPNGDDEATATAVDTDTALALLPADSPAIQGNSSTNGLSVKNSVVDESAMSILDLRELPSASFRIVGSSYWVTEAGRYRHGGNSYLLVREPDNESDVNAVAVYGKGRKVGYLSQAKASAIAPILDGLPFDAFCVGGQPPDDKSIRMWVDVPAIPKLTAFAKSVADR